MLTISRDGVSRSAVFGEFGKNFIEIGKRPKSRERMLKPVLLW
jgi:hypothetical protein